MPTTNHTHDDELSPTQILFLSDVQEQGLDVKLALLKHHARLAELLAQEIMEDEVTGLAGERYTRDKPMGGRYARWGTNPGSVEIDGERVPIRVPRVRDREADVERPLESYQKMKQPTETDTKLQEAILLGLSQRDYTHLFVLYIGCVERIASAFLDGFGLSQSSDGSHLSRHEVSMGRRFQERSRKALEEFEKRSLEEMDLVALLIDGKYLAAQQIVICLGVDMDRHKIPLGFVETTTENTGAIKGLFQDLLDRGLDFSQGLLCVVDGTKGLRKAVREIFGEFRCQFHKRENVVSYLKESDSGRYRRKFQRAYELPTYEVTKAALMEIHAELIGDTQDGCRCRSMSFR